MAVDKLVDSTQLDSDLTSVANAIRAKSGGSSQLAFPAGFVSEIQAIPSGGGSSNRIDSDNYCIVYGIVTVGSNTVTKAPQVREYLQGLLGVNTTGTYVKYWWGIVDWDGTAVNNLALCTDQNSTNFYRYRNGAISSVSNSANYDAVIRNGDKYLIIGMFWKGAPTV